MSNILWSTYCRSVLFIDGLLYSLCSCKSCGNIFSGVFCKNCLNHISLHEPPFCKMCGISITHNKNNMCKKCKKSKMESDIIPFVHSMFSYEGILKLILYNYKKSGIHILSYVLALFLVKYIKERVYEITKKEELQDMLLIPIPANPKHKSELGFDHMNKVCRSMCRVFPGFKMQCILKRRPSQMQKNLSIDRRKKNIKKSLFIPQNIKVKRSSLYLLIDDVVTTGATVTYAYNLLKDKVKQENIIIFSLSRVI